MLSQHRRFFALLVGSAAPLLAIGFTSCDGADRVGRDAAEGRPDLPADLEFEVIREGVVGNERRSLDVRLSRPVTEGVLERLAQKLRDEDARVFARTFIVYYLPGMPVDEGGWATSHFDPELNTRILGMSPPPVSRFAEIRDKYGDALIGIWETSQIGFASTFVLFETAGGVGLDRIFPDGSTGTSSLREETATAGRRFRDPTNRFGEFWLVRSGNLELHDPEELVFVARPIPETR